MKDKSGIPRSEAINDSGHEPSDENELTTYLTLFRMQEETQREVGQPSTTPPLPPTEPDVPSPSLPLEDQVQDLTSKLEAYWDETQEHQVSLNQEVDRLKADMHIVLCNQATILHN